jgi:hypothetical protein
VGSLQHQVRDSGPVARVTKPDAASYGQPSWGMVFCTALSHTLR